MRRFKKVDKFAGQKVEKNIRINFKTLRFVNYLEQLEQLDQLGQLGQLEQFNRRAIIN